MNSKWLGVVVFRLLQLLCILDYVIQCGATFNWRRYDGYKVFRVDLKESIPVDQIRHLERYPNEYDFWSHGTAIEGPVDVMVSPKAIPNFLGLPLKHKTNYSFIIDDVQNTIGVFSKNATIHFQKDFSFPQYHRLIEEQVEEARNRATNRMNWKTFHPLNTIEEYMWGLEDEFPDIVKVYSIGQTYDDRNLIVAKIGKGSHKKPAIWMDGGFHAREWIAPAVVSYITDRLLREYHTNSTVREMVDNVDWYMLPVANPDGYEYSHSRDRLWRRNRSKTWLFCRGVDLNRNFPYHWLEFGMGASIIPCTQSYAGSYPGSEPEVKSITNYILSINDTLKVYLSFHSYGQLWLTPWAYIWGWPFDYEELHSLAKTATDEIRKKYYTRYRVGPTSFVLYLASGTSQDWARGVAGIKYSYTVELRDRGLFGFLLPPWDIEPTCEETWDGIVAMYKELVKRNFE